MADTVKIVTAFDPDPSKIGKTQDVDALTARILVADGTAQYATDAQERKADPLKAADKS